MVCLDRSVRPSLVTVCILVWVELSKGSLALAPRLRGRGDDDSNNNAGLTFANVRCTTEELPNPIWNYVNTTKYYRFPLDDHDKHGSQWKLFAKSPIISGWYPDSFSFNGSSAFRLNGTAEVTVNTTSKTGHVRASVYGWMRPSSKPPQLGEWVIEFNSFGDAPNSPPWGMPPMVNGGVNSNLLMHGCTNQGEPTFPMLTAYLATWGVASVYLNGTLITNNAYGHLMYSDRSKDRKTMAMYARKPSCDDDGNHTCTNNDYYDPTNCMDGYADRSNKELWIIAAPMCLDPDLKRAKVKFPPVQQLWAWTFHDIVDVSETAARLGTAAG